MGEARLTNNTKPMSEVRPGPKAVVWPWVLAFPVCSLPGWKEFSGKGQWTPLLKNRRLRGMASGPVSVHPVPGAVFWSN